MKTPITLPAVEKNLQALADHLAAVTRSSIVTGFGPTYVEEIKQLDRAIVEVRTLRNGVGKAADVIAGLEKERRAMTEQIALLTRETEANEKAQPLRAAGAGDSTKGKS